MSKLLDRYNSRIGMKIEYWTLIEYKYSERKRPIYLCQCICGTEKLVKYCGGKKGLTSLSCGCSSYQRTFKRKPGPRGNLKKYASRYSGYKTEARNRNYSFNLTYEEAVNLFEGNCFYCNIGPSNSCEYSGLQIKYNGIDRVDNTKGYSIQNCVSCCKNCNQIKKAVPPEMVYKIYQFLFGEKNV